MRVREWHVCVQVNRTTGAVQQVTRWKRSSAVRTVMIQRVRDCTSKCAFVSPFEYADRHSRNC